LDTLRSLEMHKRTRGKIKIFPSMSVNNFEDLSLAYIPGSLAAAMAIQENPEDKYEYTGIWNRIAILTNGTKVFGLRNLRPSANMPILEGKSLLFRVFGDISGIPLCLDTTDPEEFIRTTKLISENFGAIDLENIAHPHSFSILRTLQKDLEIPVYCDNQDGTSVVVLGGIINALKIVGKKMEDVKIVIAGAGNGGIATAQLLHHVHAGEIVILNKEGSLSVDTENLTWVEQEMAETLNLRGPAKSLEESLEGADIFVGLSVGGILKKEMVEKMATDPVLFALALPEPEISYEEALAGGATVMGMSLLAKNTWNPMTSLLAFPGVLKGLLLVQARTVNLDILQAAAEALADTVDPRRLSAHHIMPEVFSDETTPRIAEAVGQKAISLGIAGKTVPPGYIYNLTWERLFGNNMRML
ncbi:MAG TPA: malic enzyme-like NAD(P)-binding protein, partial [Synergistaceae bacterium]|nr:malic enzyme-like NAD(P)-binding protein [Synergistaceae bacterium]